MPQLELYGMRFWWRLATYTTEQNMIMAFLNTTVIALMYLIDHENAIITVEPCTICAGPGCPVG